MSLFKRKKTSAVAGQVGDAAVLAQRALDFIAEGVMLVDERGMVVFANPSAAAMTGYGSPDNITGLDYQLVVRLENAEQKPVEPTQSRLYTAIMTNQSLSTREYLLVPAQSDRKIAIALVCIPTGGPHADRIINFRDITVELAEEHEQAEFISTASHEMRTPVASIEGYLGLALNPQTATIDARARQYLEAAHAASKHLGNLFKDLLDVTKLDDKRLKTRLVPVNATQIVEQIAGERLKEMQAKNIRYRFGGVDSGLDKKRIEPKVYMAVDMDFMHEILDNLVGNAVKYTPEGGEIVVTVRGDGDKVLITVADSGIGIGPDDINHIFQKFYRVDNSQTREIGGTGLGLYLVKQRVETMGGRVWVESEFGKGSTFFVSLPRISESEYERMMIARTNEQMVRSFSAPNSTPNTDAGANGGQPASSQQIITSGQVANSAVTQAAGQTLQVTEQVQPAQQPTVVGQTPVQQTQPVQMSQHPQVGPQQTVRPTPVAQQQVQQASQPGPMIIKH